MDIEFNASALVVPNRKAQCAQEFSTDIDLPGVSDPTQSIHALPPCLDLLKLGVLRHSITPFNITTDNMETAMKDIAGYLPG